jgi:hypothetical protein
VAVAKKPLPAGRSKVKGQMHVRRSLHVGAPVKPETLRCLTIKNIAPKDTGSIFRYTRTSFGGTRGPDVRNRSLRPVLGGTRRPRGAQVGSREASTGRRWAQLRAQGRCEHHTT